MNNTQWISENNIGTIKSLDNLLSAMEKYGDNHWWESDDLNVLGYYQMNEHICIIDFSKFHESIEHLLGHPVWTHEFAFRWDELAVEAKSRFLRLGYNII